MRASKEIRGLPSRGIDVLCALGGRHHFLEVGADAQHAKGGLMKRLFSTISLLGLGTRTFALESVRPARGLGSPMLLG
jgi:hypothetical protein